MTSTTSSILVFAHGRVIDTVDEIIPNLYLSGIWCLKFVFPEFDDFTHVLSITDNKPLPIEYTKKLLHIDLEDDPLAKIQFNEEVFNFIDEGISNSNKILIHCQEGRSRSVSYVVAYLIKRHNLLYEDAIAFVMSKRDININCGFIKALKSLDAATHPQRHA